MLGTLDYNKICSLFKRFFDFITTFEQNEKYLCKLKLGKPEKKNREYKIVYSLH